jgi:hypothetical protein
MADPASVPLAHRKGDQMLKLVKECAPWLSWKTAGIAALVAVGLIVCTGMPSLAALAGAMPLLLILACLVPCLAPLVLLRRSNRSQDTTQRDTIPLVALQEQAGNTCGCGQDSCGIGSGSNTCQSEQAATQTAR